MNSLACCAGSCAQLLNVGRGSSTSPLDTGLHPQLNCRTGSESYRSGTHPTTCGDSVAGSGRAYEADTPREESPNVAQPVGVPSCFT